jgi:hypothetical protein
MTTLIMLCLVIWGVKAGIKAYQEAEVRKNNPDAWVRLREIEQRERLMKREGIKNAAGFGLTIARMFMGK